jgi:HEAT repeat protein
MRRKPLPAIAMGLLVLLPPPALADGAGPAAGAAAPGAPAGPPSPEAIDRLVEQLGSDSYDARERATEALVAAGSAARPALERALASGDAEVRFRARLVLRAGLRRATVLLHEAVRRGGAPEEEPFQQLVALGEEAVDPLAMLARRDLADYGDGGDDRVQTALHVLETIAERAGAASPVRAHVRDALVGLIEQNLRGLDRRLADALRATGADEARSAVAKKLAAKQVALRCNAVAILGAIGGRGSIDAIATAVGDPDPTVRAAAIGALAAAARALPAGDPSGARGAATAAIGGALGDADRNVETQAIRALGELRATRFTPAIRRIVAAATAGAGSGGAPAADERLAAAVMALGLLGDGEAVPLILPFLDAPRADVVGAAADALGLLRSRAAVPALLALLSKEDPAPLVRAIRALGRIGDARAFEPLKAFYLDRKLFRQRVLAAIAKLDGPGPLAFLVERAKASEDEFEVRLALEAISRRGRAATAELGEAAVAALGRQPAELRMYALRLITRAKYAPAYDAVVRLIPSNDPRLATAAAEAAAAIGDRRAIEPLRGLLKSTDEDVQRAGVVALARLGEPEALKRAIDGAEAQVARAPDSIRDRFDLGLFYLYAKENAKGAAQFEEILKQNPKHEVAAYNLACARSLLGEKDAALAALRRSVDLGFRDWRHMEQDDDLDPIRETTEMKAIMSQLRAAEAGGRDSGIVIVNGAAVHVQGGGDLLDDDDPAEGE